MEAGKGKTIGDLTLQLYGQIEADPVSLLRKLFESEMVDFLTQLYINTRAYDAQLGFAEHMLDAIQGYRARVPQKEFEKWDMYFSTLKLSALDYLNRWREYLEYYDQVRKEKLYTIRYSNTVDPERFGDSLMAFDGEFYYVHFLHANRRRDIVERKYNKWLAGKNVEHLKRHPQSDLSDEEIQRRITVLSDWMELHFAYRSLYDIKGSPPGTHRASGSPPSEE